MIRLIIVDDELLMRIGLRSMIQWEEHGFEIAGEASNGREALELAVKVAPDLIITDVRMPIMDGLELIREAGKVLPNCTYIILSNFDEFRYVKEAMQLGASDYLIKSEIKQESLVQLLAKIRQQLSSRTQPQPSGQLPEADYRQSLAYLKEALFKEAISGLQSEQDIAAKAKQLNVRLQPEDLFMLKLKIEQFDELKKKYVEQDEKLLRFSIVNILEEIIPGRWSREIVVESSAEYLLLMNTSNGGGGAPRIDIEKLCGKIIRSLKDFMNVQLTVGVSTTVRGYRYIKLAYQEASIALRQRFYAGAGRVLFFDDIERHPVQTSSGIALSRNQEQEYQVIIEGQSASRLQAFLEGLRLHLERERASEEDIRGIYVSLVEYANTYFTTTLRARLLADDRSLYEVILEEGTWTDVHHLVYKYIVGLFESELKNGDQQTYADMAIRIMERYYHADISLQSVAKQINVNPSYLSRVFKQETQMNFVNYLIGLRINKAKLLLENKQLKVYEIAERVGYHNYSYFSRMFRKVVGVSPEEYRN